MYFGALDGDSAASMFEDLADLFEQAAADGTPIREIVGEDPVEFVEAFVRNYSKGEWVDRERERLTSAIERAEEKTPARRGHGPMTTQPAQAIHVQGLEKSYKKLQVLRGVDFDVARGSIFALLGSNGAGKTTVVKILSTLLKADAGTASVNGFDVATQAGERAGVHQPHRAVRGRRRDPQRAGEPRAGRPAAAPQGPGHDRG